MRLYSLGLALVLALAACGGEESKPPPHTPAATPAEPAPAAAKAEHAKEEPKHTESLAEMQKKVGMAMAEAINAHDAKKIASLYTDNAVVKMAGGPDTVGREAITAHWQKIFDTFSNVKTMASRVWMKNDVTVVEWAWTGNHTGDMMGIKATEKPVGVAGADVMWFTPDGMIKEQHVYTDMGTVMAQIGASKHKARGIPQLASAPQITASTGSADEAKNVEAMSKIMASFEKKSESDFLGGASDDVVWDDMTQPESMKGKAAGKKYFTEVTKAFPDIKSTAVNSWGIGDYVITEGTMSGTHKAAFMGIQPTKKQMTLHGLDIVQMKDGKIVKGTSYGNGMEMMTQLGLVPPPGAKDAKDAKAATPAPKTDTKSAAPAKK